MQTMMLYTYELRRTGIKEISFCWQLLLGTSSEEVLSSQPSVEERSVLCVILMRVGIHHRTVGISVSETPASLLAVRKIIRSYTTI